jgi:hypothetical protein
LSSIRKHLEKRQLEILESGPEDNIKKNALMHIEFEDVNWIKRSHDGLKWQGAVL